VDAQAAYPDTMVADKLKRQGLLWCSRLIALDSLHIITNTDYWGPL